MRSSFSWILGMRLFIIIGGLISLILYYKHILNILLSLEYIRVALTILLITLVGFECISSVRMMYFFVFIACEGALGLGVLINLIRCYGRDYFLLINIVQC